MVGQVKPVGGSEASEITDSKEARLTSFVPSEVGTITDLSLRVVYRG